MLDQYTMSVDKILQKEAKGPKYTKMGRYEANIRRWKEEGRRMLRSRKERIEQREKEGVSNKGNWFKTGG